MPRPYLYSPICGCGHWGYAAFSRPSGTLPHCGFCRIIGASIGENINLCIRGLEAQYASRLLLRRLLHPLQRGAHLLDRVEDGGIAVEESLRRVGGGFEKLLH